jgi:hypothetical protein
VLAIPCIPLGLGVRCGAQASLLRQAPGDCPGAVRDVRSLTLDRGKLGSAGIALGLRAVLERCRTVHEKEARDALTDALGEIEAGGDHRQDQAAMGQSWC